MDKVVTEDKSITYYNTEVGDHYHTKSGAKEEAFEKHAKALKIKDSSVILDICFGLGYNTAAALDLIDNCVVYCFENDKEILRKVLEINADFKSWSIIQEFVKGFFDGKSTYEKDGIKLIMVYGDAKKEIRKVKEKADYVFFDPFSPAKVPDMWSAEFLKDIFERMNKDGKLSTYSYARFVRDNMKKAGFEVIDGPKIGRRSPSTIAIKSL